MGKRPLNISLAIVCALALSALAASSASATATAYTVGSSTAISQGESTGIALDQLSNWTMDTELFGAEITIGGSSSSVDCENCMGENQGSPMDVTGSGGRLLLTGKSVSIPNCAVEDPKKGAGTVTTEPLKFTAANPGSVTISPVNGIVFAVIHFVGAKCPIAGDYELEGASITGTITGDVLTVNSTTELTLEGNPSTLQGSATITAGTTGGTYHAIELK